jgi:DHA3 family macrolide efflux protein-like MFS transporter
MAEIWFGALELAQTLAMVLSGALVASIATRLKPTRVISFGLIVLGFVTALFAAAGNIWHLAIILFAMGGTIPPIQASVSTLTQTAIPDVLRGRIGAALGMMVTTANLLSMAFAGLFGELVGIRNVFALSGVLVVLAGLASARVFAGSATAQAETSPVLQGESG